MDIKRKSKNFASCWVDDKLHDRLNMFIRLNPEYTRSRFIREAIRNKLEKES